MDNWKLQIKLENIENWFNCLLSSSSHNDKVLEAKLTVTLKQLLLTLEIEFKFKKIMFMTSDPCYSVPFPCNKILKLLILYQKYNH